jgi:hypothetical protein
LNASAVAAGSIAHFEINHQEIQITMSESSIWIRGAACALAAMSSVAAAKAEFCGTAPAGGFDQPPNPAHAGHYRNQVYGYSLAIPNALSGFTPAGGPERGFGIVLSWMPRAYLSVDAGYDAYYDISAEGVHRRDVNAVRLHDQLLSDQAANYALAGTAGGRYVMRVQCAGDARIFIHDDVIVVRNREIYRLHLQSVPERYAGDVKVLNALLRSWRWQAPGKPYVK